MTTCAILPAKFLPLAATWLLIVTCLNVCSVSAATADEASAKYESHVKPLLKARCYACHGAWKQKAGLRLDTAKFILQGGDSGEAIVPGNAKASPILDRVATNDVSQRMPPEHEGEPLKADEIKLIRDWIEAGAPAPEAEEPEHSPKDHWSFRPIERPALPQVKNAQWVRNPIDAWIAARHEQQGLAPQKEAPRIVLLRRVYLDLIGLPPTTEEIAAAQADTSPQWYENIVDKLLADPRYGERWGRHWMDVWRYSDWWGLNAQLRNSQKHIWHWRDWIVESLNEDRPYDEMIQMMLAADELAPNDPQELRASGFLARNFFIFNRDQWMDEVVTHVSKGFLGLTMNCAKCHDHKFDPIRQVDYYRMRAFFEPYHVRTDVVPGATVSDDGIPRAFDGKLDTPTYLFIRGDESRPDKSHAIEPGVPEILAFGEIDIQPVELPVQAWRPESRRWVLDNYIAAAEESLKAAKKKQGETAEAELLVAEANLKSIQLRAAAITAEIEGDDAARQQTRQDAIQAQRELAFAKARLELLSAETSLAKVAEKDRKEAEKKLATAKESLKKQSDLLKAEIKPEDKVEPFVGAKWSATRFGSTQRDDPEFAFPSTSTGRRTALARWITDKRNPLTARVAVNHLWNRHFAAPLAPVPFDLGRNSAPTPYPELIDYLATELIDHQWSMKHLHRLIVTSATYRMSSSQAGMEANLAKDPDNQFWWRRRPIRLESQAIRDSILYLAGTLDPTMGGPSVPTKEQANSKRRSLYFFHSNNERNPFLLTFDEAEVTECYRREQSVVPQQALAMTNSDLVLQSAQQIAQRISASAMDDQQFVRQAFVTIVGIDPTKRELAAGLKALQDWNQVAGDSGDKARGHLVWILLNHNDFITVR